MSSAKHVPSTSCETMEVDSIIHPKWLVPMTEMGLVLTQHSLAIKDNKILAIATTEEITNTYHSSQEYLLDNHVLIPGFINAHGHTPMTLFRGFADDMPLKSWLEDAIWPAESKWVNEDFVTAGTELAIAEMLLSGTTCFSDMYFFPDQIAKSALAANIRVQIAAPILDFPTIWAQDADEYITKATTLHDQYKNDDHVRLAFGPHAPYTVSDAPLQKISSIAHELDIGIHIHLHENADEVSSAIATTGIRPLQRLSDLGLLSPRLQCVHVTQLSDAEVSLLAETGVSVMHCPASNMKLASGFCRTADLLNSGVNICLGTDSPASNNDLDMIKEMRLAALVGKGVAGDAAALPACQVLAMATINGAKAMGMEEFTGSLDVGKFADITAIDLNHLNTQPVYDPISALVYSAQAKQVSHVWVGGKLNVENGELLNFKASRLIKKAQLWAENIQQH